ncbi:MAG: hypothetical protein ABUR63_07755 [Verrucomicrobiota bacterium]
MTFRPRALTATFVVSILSASASPAAYAKGPAKSGAEPEASEEESADEAVEPAESSGAAKTPKPASVAEPPAEPTGSGLVVERLPPSAFPSWTKRGIVGGSLWLDPSFHGMQWPYYPKTGIGLSGSVWADNSYQKIYREERFPRTDYWVHEARAALRVTPTYTSGEFFVQGQVELIGNYNEKLQPQDAPDTDDLWLRFGHWKHWDIQVGRFEAFALHHFGMGLDVNTVERKGALDESMKLPVDFNYATTMFYRPNGPGNVALHLHFWEGEKGLPTIRGELLGQYGYEDVSDAIGVRPALIVDFGIVKVKVGTEHKWRRPRDTQVQTIMTPRVDGNGAPVIDPMSGSQIIDLSYVHTRNEKYYDRCLAAGTVQLVLFPWVEAGVQGAYCMSDHTTQMGGTDINGSYTQWTAGGFANLRPLPDVVLGGGANLTDWTNLRQNDLGRFGHQTNFVAFGAIQYLLYQQLYVKLVGAYEKAKKEDLEGGTTQVTNTMMSARIRLMYLF